MAKKIETKLVVVQPFGDRQIGDTITGDDMAAVLESHPSHVVKAAADDPPPPEGDPEPEGAPVKVESVATPPATPAAKS